MGWLGVSAGCRRQAHTATLQGLLQGCLQGYVLVMHYKGHSGGCISMRPGHVHCNPGTWRKFFKSLQRDCPKFKGPTAHPLLSSASSPPRPASTPRLTPPPPVRAFSTHRPALSRSWPPFLRPLALWRARYQPAQPASSLPPTCSNGLRRLHALLILTRVH